MSIQAIGNTTSGTQDLSPVPEPFTIAELIAKIFTEYTLTPHDAARFGTVCKTLRYRAAEHLFKVFRENDGYTYNWNACQGRECAEKIQYGLSHALVQYSSSPAIRQNKKNRVPRRGQSVVEQEQKPTKKVRGPSKKIVKLQSFLSSFPVGKTFIETISQLKNRQSIAEDHDDRVKEEPILYATIKIYRLAIAHLPATNRFVPFMPTETLQIVSGAISAGATCLGKIAFVLFKKHHSKNTLSNRLLPLVRKIALQAAEMKDPSGRNMLVKYIEDKKLFPLHGISDNPVISLQDLLNIQWSGRLSGEDAVAEKELLQKITSDLANYIRVGRHLPSAIDLMLQCLSLEKYEEANLILDSMLESGMKLYGASEYITAIKIKTHLSQRRKVNKLYDALVASKYKKAACKDISFLTEWSLFKLQYKPRKRELKPVNTKLMQYWNNHLWHSELCFNFLNSHHDISSAEDYKNPHFQKLIQTIITIKERVKKDSEAQWFKNILAVIRVDLNDSDASAAVCQELLQQAPHSLDLSLPMLLQEKIHNILGRRLAEVTDDKEKSLVDNEQLKTQLEQKRRQILRVNEEQQEQRAQLEQKQRLEMQRKIQEQRDRQLRMLREVVAEEASSNQVLVPVENTHPEEPVEMLEQQDRQLRILRELVAQVASRNQVLVAVENTHPEEPVEMLEQQARLLRILREVVAKVASRNQVLVAVENTHPEEPATVTTTEPVNTTQPEPATVTTTEPVNTTQTEPATVTTTEPVNTTQPEPATVTKPEPVSDTRPVLFDEELPLLSDETIPAVYDEDLPDYVDELEFFDIELLEKAFVGEGLPDDVEELSDTDTTE